MTTTLFVPTLNEIEGLRALSPRLKREWVDQILVVDGGSTDGTADYARSLGWDVYVQKKRGLRHAYIEAWPLIKGDVVVTFSPDGNCIPELIPTLIAKVAEGYDMVVASRYLAGARSYDDTAMTGFGNWLFTRVLINGLHRGKFTDSLNIFRAYPTRLFYELDLHKDETYSPERCWGTIIGIETILSTRALKRKLKIGEIPGDEPKRLGGKAKLQAIRWGGAYAFQVIRELWFWR